MKAIKYYSKQVCFQEIPDEISFAYFISGCPNRCPDCHSKHLWEDNGTFVTETLKEDLRTKGRLCTCVLFMGGDDPKQQFELQVALNYCRSKGFKTHPVQFEHIDPVPPVEIQQDIQRFPPVLKTLVHPRSKPERKIDFCLFRGILQHCQTTGQFFRMDLPERPVRGEVLHRKIP